MGPTFAMLVGGLALGPSTAQEVVPPCPYDRVHALEITAEDPELIDGRGPTVVAEYEAEFSGTLHLWTRSELDLFLRVEDPMTGDGLAEDDDSGGGTTPYLELVVGEGDLLAVLVAGVHGAQLGPLELHAVACPETEATRQAATIVQGTADRVRELRASGELDSARGTLRALLEDLRSRPGIEHSQRVTGALSNLGYLVRGLGDLEAIRAVRSLHRAARERTLPENHPELARARGNLAVTLRQMGDLRGALALEEAVLAARERALPADHPDLLGTRLNLANTVKELGDLQRARELQETAVAGYERTMPPDHRQLLAARGNLANTMQALGDLRGACELHESVVAGYERTLPADHPDLLRARLGLAASKSAMGDLAGARALKESAVAGYERTMPPDHPHLLRARLNLGVTLWEMRDLSGARTLFESVLAACERTLPLDHPDLLTARQNLANTMKQMGDLPGARALEESVLAARERTLPADHPGLLVARLNVASTMRKMGDLPGARALGESVVQAYEGVLPSDHPDLLAARQNLAITMKAMGDLRGARALEESVLADHERTLPADHPRLLATRESLANTMDEMGDLPGARALLESVLAVRERTLPPDHPDLQSVRQNLATTLDGLGDRARARALEETVLAVRERTLPADHPDLLAVRGNLAATLHAMGDLPGARALVLAQTSGLLSRILTSLALAPREARETVAEEAHRLAGVLLWTRSAGPELQRSVFELQETMRMVAGEAARALGASEDPEVGALLAEAGAVRAALHDLALGGGDPEGGAPSSELSRLLQQRDRLEREASGRLAEMGIVVQAVEVERLAEGLAADAALVAYRRIAHWSGPGGGGVQTATDHVLAHVLAKDGSLTRIDLGEARSLEELVLAWRRALGRPLAGRGVALEAESAPADGGSAQGHALRERLVDPVLARLGEDVRTLHVCADDLVFLVPLDALPAGDGVLGDRYRIVQQVSGARLAARTEPAAAGPGLLIVGGVNYDAGLEDPTPLTARAEVDLRSGTATFAPLPGARAEADALRRLHDATFQAEALVLGGAQATKEALAVAVRCKRWVHVATHGWFARETIRSSLDDEPAIRDGSRMDLEERVTGMAPMLLSGLALAGANRGRDPLGRVPGLLTAEELCSLDLSSCDLAVLSACETNVGIRRAGQGIQSLQAALYAAGARSSITSLWKVDDAATRRLMEIFYTNLWEEEMPKAEALWEAKKVLRDEGAPVRDWAGWVLTGDPD